jgi:hypothetical protein
VLFSCFELFQCFEPAFPSAIVRDPNKFYNIQSLFAFNGQIISSIALIIDPYTKLEVPFMMPSRDSAVIFSRLELFQCRDSFFPCDFATARALVIRFHA